MATVQQSSGCRLRGQKDKIGLGCYEIVQCGDKILFSERYQKFLTKTYYYKDNKKVALLFWTGHHGTWEGVLELVFTAEGQLLGIQGLASWSLSLWQPEIGHDGIIFLYLYFGGGAVGEKVVYQHTPGKGQFSL